MHVPRAKRAQGSRTVITKLPVLRCREQKMGCVTSLQQMARHYHGLGIPPLQRSKGKSSHCRQVTEAGLPEQKSCCPKGHLCFWSCSKHSLLPLYNVWVSFLLLRRLLSTRYNLCWMQQDGTAPGKLHYGLHHSHAPE